MKKLLTLIVLTILFVGCSNNEDKAKDLIKAELSKTMNDFKSYDPVEFSGLDSNITEFNESDLLDNDTLILSKKSDVELLLKRSKENFNPEFVGYRMRHKFRGKNAVGALVLNHFTFYLNKDLTEVIEIQDNFLLEEEIKRKLIDSQKRLELLESYR